MRKFLFPRIHGPDHDLCIRSITELFFPPKTHHIFPGASKVMLRKTKNVLFALQKTGIVLVLNYVKKIPQT